MLRIRFLRVGKKNRPSFRLIVAPRRTAPKTGNFLEILGFHDPIKHEKSFKKERIQYWISQGAKPSDTVHNMLIKEGIIEGEKIGVHKKGKAEEIKEETKKEISETKETPEAEEVKEAPAEEPAK